VQLQQTKSADTLYHRVSALTQYITRT